MNRFRVTFGLAVVAFVGSRTSAHAADAPFTFDAREPDPTWEVDSSIWGESYSIQSPQSQEGGNQEGVSLAMTQFLAPLRDDGSPYSLRPYLQRTSSLSVSTTAGHFSTHNPFGGQDRTWTSGGIGGGLAIYLKRWFVLTANLGYEYGVLHDVDISQSTHTLSGGAGVGFRARDWLAIVNYDLDTSHSSGSSWASPRKYTSLTLFGAIARRFTISLSGNTVPAGGGGRLGVEYYPSPGIGIFGSGSASTGRLYQSPMTLTSYAGSAGIAAWIDASSGIVGSYTRTAYHEPMQVVGALTTSGYHETSNQLALQVYMRFP